MDNSYERFVREVTDKEDSSGLSIGMRDKRGNLLVLGGWKSSLWQLKNGLYFVGNDIVASPVVAMQLYNQANNAGWDLDHIEKRFNPWYERQVEYILVPSRSDVNVSYKVRREPGGVLTCECRGFVYRGDCWHVQAVKELTSEG